MDTELIMFKRVQEAEEKWRGAQALIEQIKATFSEKERELENKMEELKRQQEKELFKLSQDNYILQAKVLDILSYFSFLLIKKELVLPAKCIVIFYPWGCLAWCSHCIKHEHSSWECLFTQEPKSNPMGQNIQNFYQLILILLLAVFFKINPIIHCDLQRRQFRRNCYRRSSFRDWHCVAFLSPFHFRTISTKQHCNDSPVVGVTLIPAWL